MKTASIPYANVFGFVEEEQALTLQEYIDKVMEPASSAAPAGDEPPRYIFSATRSSLPDNSSLHDAIMVPSVALDKENMDTVSPQWYLGAPNTGRCTEFAHF